MQYCDFCIIKCDNPECKLIPKENNVKAILQFNLDNEDDVFKYKQANNSLQLRYAIEDITEALRQKRKYNNNEVESLYLAKFEEKVFEILQNRGIDIWDI